MKIIFMGTPDFSVGTLEALVEAGHEVVLAVTQPDKPKGRGKDMQFTPVKEAAIRHRIPVFQPKKIREASCIEELKSYPADVMVVVAFGQILPKEILEMTPYGCINVHASEIPRGSSDSVGGYQRRRSKRRDNDADERRVGHRGHDYEDRDSFGGEGNRRKSS